MGPFVDIPHYHYPFKMLSEDPELEDLLATFDTQLSREDSSPERNLIKVRRRYGKYL